ncbi:hypothetical protein QTP88_001637 [Uroleucon formosanum]
MLSAMLSYSIDCEIASVKDYELRFMYMEDNTIKDKEIYAIDRNMMKTFEQNKLATSPAYSYINRAGKRVSFPNASITKNINNKKKQEILTEDDVYSESIKGMFGWEFLEGYFVPYIIRIINGDNLKFVPVRIAEMHLLSKYINYLHANMYNCTSIKSYFISDCEAKLLNEINQIHNEGLFGREMFIAGKDFIVTLDDVHEFYIFLDVCYKKLLCVITPNNYDKCGFIRIDTDSVVPYVTKDGKQYLPIFYFAGDTKSLMTLSVKFEHWNLAYLKFCCKIQGISNNLYSKDSYDMIDLENVKKFYSPGTNFEKFWPPNVIDTELLINQHANHVNLPGAWIRPPLKGGSAENIIHQSLIKPLPPITQRFQENQYQNQWPANKLSPPQPQAQPSTDRKYSVATRNQNVAPQGSTMSQGSSSRDSVVQVVRPMPLLISTLYTNTAPVIGNTASNSIVGPRIQNMTSLNNPMINSNVISHPNQVQESHPPRAKSNPPKHRIFQQPRKTYSGQHRNGGSTNTRPRKFRNTRDLVIGEIIDLSSPPSSPVPLSVLELESLQIPEQAWVTHADNNSGYKIQRMAVGGKIIRCINSRPYIYSDLMVLLSDLVKIVLSSCTVQRCAYVLAKYMKKPLYCGNCDQLAMLRENGRIWEMSMEQTLMVMVQDIANVISDLRKLVSMTDEEIQQSYQSASEPSNSYQSR